MINKEQFIKSYIEKIATKFALSYDLAFDDIMIFKYTKNIQHEQEYKLNTTITYSHNDYFKSEKSFYDLIQINNGKEGNKIEFLLNLWRDKASGKENK